MVELFSVLGIRGKIELGRIAMLFYNFFISVCCIVEYQDIIACCIINLFPSIGFFIRTEVCRFLQNIVGVSICLYFNRILSLLGYRHFIRAAYLHHSRRIKELSLVRLHGYRIGIGFFGSIVLSVNREVADLVSAIHRSCIRLGIRCTGFQL